MKRLRALRAFTSISVIIKVVVILSQLNHRLVNNNQLTGMKKILQIGLMLSCMAIMFTCVAAPDNIKQKKSDELSIGMYDAVVAFTSNEALILDENIEIVPTIVGEVMIYKNMPFAIATMSTDNPVGIGKFIRCGSDYTAILEDDLICPTGSITYIKKKKDNYIAPFVDTRYVWETQHQMNC